MTILIVRLCQEWKNTVIISLIFRKTMRLFVRTKTTAIYQVTQNITTEEKKEGREIYFLYSFSLGGGHKIFGQRTIKEVGIC